MIIYCKAGDNAINCFKDAQEGYGLIMPSMPDVANLICEDVDGVHGIWVDNTVAMAQAEVNKIARAYLAETDWYVTRFVETEVAVPTEIATERAAARLRIIN